MCDATLLDGSKCTNPTVYFNIGPNPYYIVNNLCEQHAQGCSYVTSRKYLSK